MVRRKVKGVGVRQRRGQSFLPPFGDDSVLVGDDHRGGLSETGGPRARVESSEFGARLEECDGVSRLDDVEHPVRIAGAGDLHDAIRDRPKHARWRPACGSGAGTQRPELDPLPGRVRPSVRRRHGDEPDAAVGCTVGEQLGDGATHRVADGDEAVHAEPIEGAEGVGRTVFESEGGSGTDAVAMTVVVDDDDSVLLRQRGNGVRPVRGTVDVPPVEE